jgi:hypothetical protein
VNGYDAIYMVGEISADGKHLWDGNKWVAIRDKGGLGLPAAGLPPAPQQQMGMQGQQMGGQSFQNEGDSKSLYYFGIVWNFVTVVLIIFLLEVIRDIIKHAENDAGVVSWYGTDNVNKSEESVFSILLCALLIISALVNIYIFYKYNKK